MGEVQAQPVSSFADPSPGAHQERHWPLNTTAVWEKPCGLADSYYRIQPSYNVQDKCKHFSFMLKYHLEQK